MKTLLIFVLALLPLTACDDSSGPDDADFYVLESIGGDAVPSLTDGGDVTVHGSTITLFDDGDAEFTLNYQMVGASRTEVELFGDWSQTSTEVLIDFDNGDQLIATRSGNLLLIDDVNGTWRYELR